MNEFDKLQADWQEQPIQKPDSKAFDELTRKIKRISVKQKVIYWVLGSTMAVLIAFFFYTQAFKSGQATLALGSMILVLIIRILLEFVSIRALQKLSLVANTQHFKGNLANYHKRRMRTHLLFTPLLIGIYCFAFWTLLPLFKASLSEGFYTYIVFSSVIILVVLGSFIAFEIRKEIRKLRALGEEEPF